MEAWNKSFPSKKILPSFAIQCYIAGEILILKLQGQNIFHNYEYFWLLVPLQLSGPKVLRYHFLLPRWHFHLKNPPKTHSITKENKNDELTHFNTLFDKRIIRIKRMSSKLKSTLIDPNYNRKLARLRSSRTPNVHSKTNFRYKPERRTSNI